MSRLAVQKTYKMYVGGKFIRSESGRVMPIKTDHGTEQSAKASRKDLRNTLQIARGAQAGWAAKTAYNRGQIIYRLAEMLEDRIAVLPTSKTDATAAVDRVVHHAGWSDKVTALLSTLNPVAGTYINYSHIKPLGVVLATPDPKSGLLGMVELICASALMGNATILMVTADQAPLATALSEAIATSDWPAGSVNILFGDVDATLKLGSIMDDLDCILLAGDAGKDVVTDLQQAGSKVMRRFFQWNDGKTPASPLELGNLSEVQTVWMSAYEPRGGAAAY